MTRILGALGVILALALVGVGCGDEDPQRPNLPPTASWVARPDTVSDPSGTATFVWTAADPDGEVARYEVSLDSDTDFSSTTDTVAVFTFTSDDGSNLSPRVHVVRVRPVDDDGLGGDLLEDAFVVAVPALGPAVAAVDPPDPLTPIRDPMVTFRWTATETNAAVAGFEYSLDSEIDYTATSDTMTTLTFTRADGSDTSPGEHVFRVRGIDVNGSRGNPVEVPFVIAIFDLPPEVAFTAVPPADSYVGPQVTLAWAGSDPDGNVIGYEYQLDDTTSANWVATTETSVTLDFGSGARGVLEAAANITRRYVFFLRAVDEDGKASPVVQTPFISGPANIPPIVNFVVLPDTVVTSVGEWEWQGIDSDGRVLFYEWALDREAESDPWNFTNDPRLMLSFTAADGTEEDPVLHRLSVRAFDDDSTYSDVANDFFQVGVPVQRPTVEFVSLPAPPTVYRTTIFWSSGAEGSSIASFEVALNDTSSWTVLPGTSDRYDFLFPCPDPGAFDDPPPIGSQSAPIDSSFGTNRVYLRATDDAGVQSTVVSTTVLAWTRTPFTRNPDPAGPEVTRSVGDTIRWSGLDFDYPPALDPARPPAAYEVKAIPVPGFAGVPDAQAAVDADGGAWTALAPGTSEWVISVLGSGTYVLAVRARDEADAVEPYFDYGRNVWKLTIP